MDTLELLREFIKSHVDSPPENLTLESRLDEIGLDSLTLLEMVFELEDKFGFNFPDDMPQPETVGQLVEFFEKQKTAVVNA